MDQLLGRCTRQNNSILGVLACGGCDNLLEPILLTGTGWQEEGLARSEGQSSPDMYKVLQLKYCHQVFYLQPSFPST